MLDEVKKSINASLYEKARSPLYGTLIISWVVWNWKLVYYVISVDSKIPVFTRIDCIKTELTTNWTLFYGPAISTIVILVGFEFLANYAYWLHIFYKTWRVNKKVETEGKQLLTYEQSLNLRNDIRLKEEEYEKLIQEKESMIKQLEDSIKLLNNPKKEDTKPVLDNNNIKNSKVDLLYKKFKEENKLDYFKNTCSKILNTESIDSRLPIIKDYVALSLITRNNSDGGGQYFYRLTETGKELYDMIIFK
jgi:hypothetical protein